MTAADFRRIALSFEDAEEGPHVGWGRMGATHIRLAKANRDVLTGALHTAWKLRVDKNAHASSRGRRRSARVKHRQGDD